MKKETTKEAGALNSNKEFGAGVIASAKAAGGELVVMDDQQMLLSPAEVEQMRVIEDIAGKIILKTGEVGILYRSLVQYVRQQQVAPRFLTWKLLGMGFHKARVSEVVRVAMSPDDIYNDFMASSIGFKKALLLARIGADGKPEGTPVLKLLLNDQQLNRHDATEAMGDEGNGGGDDDKKKPVQTAVRMAKAADIIFRLAKNGCKWESGDGWVLTLSKVAGKAAKAGGATN